MISSACLDKQKLNNFTLQLDCSCYWGDGSQYEYCARKTIIVLRLFTVLTSSQSFDVHNWPNICCCCCCSAKHLPQRITTARFTKFIHTPTACLLSPLTQHCFQLPTSVWRQCRHFVLPIFNRFLFYFFFFVFWFFDICQIISG